MASESARNGRERRQLLSAIREKMRKQQDAQLRPAEALLVIGWAIDCEDASDQAELLNIFKDMGGLDLMRKAFACLP